MITLKYPLGLLGLIGIPILILIYIIKSKYTEQTIASTYLWRLSEQFLKKKRNKKKLSGMISLILQILAIAIISLVISHPTITLPGAANEYLFIVDASGSMKMERNGETRLELGKKEIKRIITNSADGSTYTLVTLRDKPEVMLERNSDKKLALSFLDSIAASDISYNTRESIAYAEYYFKENPSLKGYLLTDKDFNTEDKLEVINVSDNENNYALMNVSYVNDYLAESSVTVKGKAISYLEDANLSISLYVDDNLLQTIELPVKKGEATSFKLESSLLSYRRIRVVINNEDGLLEDNEIIFYNIEEAHSYKALVVSEFPAYIKNVLEISKNLMVEVMSPTEYQELNPRGYSLYAFEAFTPDELPKDGAIWLFGSDKNVVGSGFTFQKNVTLDEYINIELKKSSQSLYKKLTEGLNGHEVAVKRYNQYGLMRPFTILYHYDNIPMIFTGLNDYGNREVVFSFDLHDSNYPLQTDYLNLCMNLIDYTFPVILDEGNYVCGDKVSVNVLPNASSIRVEAPSGRSNYLDISDIKATYLLDEVGTYKITIRINNEEKVFNIYSSLDKHESFDNVKEDYILNGESENNSFDGYYDKLIYLFIALAIIYVADWVVYCYEQYQLR